MPNYHIRACEFSRCQTFFAIRGHPALVLHFPESCCDEFDFDIDTQLNFPTHVNVEFCDAWTCDCVIWGNIISIEHYVVIMKQFKWCIFVDRFVCFTAWFYHTFLLYSVSLCTSFSIPTSFSCLCILSIRSHSLTNKGSLLPKTIEDMFLRSFCASVFQIHWAIVEYHFEQTNRNHNIIILDETIDDEILIYIPSFFDGRCCLFNEIVKTKIKNTSNYDRFDYRFQKENEILFLSDNDITSLRYYLCDFICWFCNSSKTRKRCFFLNHQNSCNTISDIDISFLSKKFNIHFFKINHFDIRTYSLYHI